MKRSETQNEALRALLKITATYEKWIMILIVTIL